MQSWALIYTINIFVLGWTTFWCCSYCNTRSWFDRAQSFYRSYNIALTFFLLGWYLINLKIFEINSLKKITIFEKNYYNFLKIYSFYVNIFFTTDFYLILIYASWYRLVKREIFLLCNGHISVHCNLPRKRGKCHVFFP